MNDVAANVRTQAGMGILPPRFNFEPVRADAKKVLTGAPFDSGPDNTILADFKEKVGKLDAPAEMKAKLIADASAALSGPFKRGFDAMFAVLRSEEHTSELQSLMRISYAVLCLKKKTKKS